MTKEQLVKREAKKTNSCNFYKNQTELRESESTTKLKSFTHLVQAQRWKIFAFFSSTLTTTCTTQHCQPLVIYRLVLVQRKQHCHKLHSQLLIRRTTNGINASRRFRTSGSCSCRRCCSDHKQGCRLPFLCAGEIPLLCTLSGYPSRRGQKAEIYHSS